MTNNAMYDLSENVNVIRDPYLPDDMPTRIIFLDIDGVMNNSAQLGQDSIEVPVSAEESDVHKGYCEAVAPVYKSCIALSDILLAVPDSAIVISSSWRFKSKSSAIWSLLFYLGSNRERGFHVRLGDAVTPWPAESTCRGDDIQAWLDKHPEVEGFVILDDEDSMGHLSDRLVQTTYETGLTTHHITKAIKILKTSRR